MTGTRTHVEQNTPLEERAQAVERLRAFLPQWRELVVGELRAHITEVTGPFSSMRQIPTFADQMVEQMLGVLAGKIDARQMQTQLRYWVQRGLGPEGAFAVMDALYQAGVEGDVEGVLKTALVEYRRQFSVGYEIARRNEVLAAHEQMQRSLYRALENQIASERATRAALERRQAQSQIAANLARVMSAARDLNELLDTAARELAASFQLDFVGVYLLDDFRQRAVLRAGAGALRGALLEKGYQLPVEGNSALAYALAKQELMLLHDGSFRGESFVKPLAPETLLTLVAPLTARGETLGALTAHSQGRDTFTAQDLPTLSLIADNLAYAIENLQLLARAQSSLQELERAQRGYVRETWARQALNSQLVYAQTQDTFLDSTDAIPAAFALSRDDTTTDTLSVPITLRGQVIGTVDLIDVTRAREWNEEEKALASSVVEQMALAVENARLFEATQQRAQETAIINEMARELSGQFEREKLFQTVYAYLPRLMPTDAFIVWLYDRAAGTVTRPALFDRGESYPDEAEPRVPTGHVARVIATGEPVIVNHSRLEWEAQKEKTDTLIGGGVPSASLLYVPLRVGAELKGVMSVQTYALDAYGEAQAALLTSVANHVVSALDNARLFAETQARVNELYFLNRSLQTLTTEVTLDTLLPRMVDQFLVQLDMDASSILMRDVENNTVVTLYAYDPNPDKPAKPGERRNLSEDADLEAFFRESGIRQYRADDAALGEKMRADLERSASKTMVWLPLLRQNQVVGVVELRDQRRARTLSADELRLAENLAAQSSVALDKAELFEETQSALAETRTLYEISARLNAATTIQEVLEAAAGPAIVNGANTAMLLRLHTNAEGEPDALEPIAAWPRDSQAPMPLGVQMVLGEVAGAESWLRKPNEPLLLGNIANAVDLDEATRARLMSRGVDTVAFLPLKLGVRWVGLLTFQWSEAHSFSPNESRLYRAIMAQAATVLDHRALFEQTEAALEQTQRALVQVQQAQDRLNLQYETANILARADSFEKAAPSLLEMTCHAFDWQIGEFWTFDDARNHLVHFSAWNSADAALRDFENEARGIQFAPGQGLVGRTWEAKRPIWIADVRTDPGFRQSGTAQQAGLVTALAFPVQSEARQFGVSVFFSTRWQELDDALMATMGSIGSQIGQFLERLRAEEAVRQQNTFLTALHDMALGLMHRLDLEELLQNIIVRAAQLVGTEHGYVHLVEANGAELRMRVGIGLYQDFIGTRVKPGQGLAGTVWQNSEPIVVDDYRHWAGRLPMVDRDVLRAVVGVPLKSGEQTVGVLGLASLDDGRVFSPAQVEAVQRFAELAAVALDNARLYAATQQALLQTRRLAEREKASAEIADRLYAAPDIKTVLQTAASELRRATGSKRAVVRLHLANNGDANANGGE